MRATWSMLLGLLAVCFLVANARADEGNKEVTLTGKLVCGKCTLHETSKCSNVLQVEKDGKTTNYYLKDKGNKASYHKGICAPDSSKTVKVTGTVSEKDGKKYITPTKVKNVE
ncbi:MAG TPA: DUF6370 family protein [Gemmataceae bacterium]|nr:DUF6370 family protein [Gemmataceae bacterium]